MGDTITGLALTYGIMQALYVREKTGLGQSVDVSLFHTGLYQMSFDVSGALITGQDVNDWQPQPPEEAQLKSQMAVLEILAFYANQNNSPLTGLYLTRDSKALVFVILVSVPSLNTMYSPSPVI